MSNFEVDTENKWTPFSMTKNAQKTIIKKSSDHRSVSFNVTLPCILTNNKKQTGDKIKKFLRMGPIQKDI